MANFMVNVSYIKVVRLSFFFVFTPPNQCIVSVKFAMEVLAMVI